MDAAIRAGQARLEETKKLLAGSTRLQPQQVSQQLQDLESQLILMGQICLGELHQINDHYQKLMLEVQRSEALLNVTKDAKCLELFRVGNPCRPGALVRTANVESNEFKPLAIPPPGTFSMAGGVLDSVGAQPADLPNTKGPKLIKKIKAGTHRVLPWCRQADFFTVNGSKDRSTFAEVYSA
jgi:hypothetical protein